MAHVRQHTRSWRRPPPRTLRGVLARRPEAVPSSRARAAVTGLILLGAALTVVSGAIHLYLWNQGYSVIAIVGPLFLVQGIAAAVTGVVTAVTRCVAAALAAAALLAGTAIGLVTSAEHGIFGFRETWAAPYARTSLYEEIAGTVLLLLAAGLLARRNSART